MKPDYKYSDTESPNDIGLIEVAREFDFLEMYAKPVCILPPEYRQDEFYTKLIVGEQKQFVLIALFLILPHPYSSFLILLHPSSLLLTLPHSSSLYSGIRYGTALAVANKNSVILRCT